MRDMEGKKAGRVRLSTFYKKSLYSHWRFTEKALGGRRFQYREVIAFSGCWLVSSWKAP